MRSTLISLSLLALFVAACGGGDEKKGKTPDSALRGGAAAPPGSSSGSSGSTTDLGAVEGAGTSGLTGAALSRYTEGWNAWLQGDLATAKKKFQEAQSLDGKSPAPPYSLGVVLERQGDVAGAQQSYRSAYTANPDHELSICAYALLLAGTGHRGEADTFMQGQRNKRQNSARLTACHGELKSIQGDHASAQQLAQDALRIDPDFKDAMVTIARDHYRARRMSLADYALKAVLVGFGDASPPRDKDNAEAHLLRGLMLRESGSRAVALQDFEAAVKRRPDLVEALVNLGSMRLEAGNAAEAAPVLESATRFAPNNALAHLNLGDAYRLLGRYADAKKEFELALAKDSSLAAAHYDLGLMFLTAPTIPGYTADTQVSTALKELQSYRTMRGPKPPPGVQDDIDDLIQRAQAKQNELKQTPAPAAAPAKPAPGAPPAKK
ncbi:MAG: tetratricopeptide repeat protein [Labilithrix sp.]|nr:tetratricopeptide repeat protein [Labilithrix sp.]MCW5816296.1 tetratricopeptide repeat protein [Labilithrix sp.]